MQFFCCILLPSIYPQTVLLPEINKQSQEHFSLGDIKFFSVLQWHLRLDFRLTTVPVPYSLNITHLPFPSRILTTSTLPL